VNRDAADILLLEGIYKSFGPLDVLQGIDLTVRRGETLVIIGQSGTGKSVTLRLMIGLLDPDEGRVLFEGEDIAGYNDQQLALMRERFAMLFQGGALFDSMTVGDNVAFGLRALGERDEERIRGVVREKLRQVGLPGTEEKMPAELSGGMKKRAALARAIAVDPEVILYDEPTTGLDPIMSDAIADLILETRESLREKNATSIVVTHDMHVALKTADRIVMLHEGRIVAEGPPETYRRLRDVSAPPEEEADRMVRQFVRGEAEGPITAVR
jgi:phospholipid/cholesterol/gamma-HCH transport system ATP-binding protein